MYLYFFHQFLKFYDIDVKWLQNFEKFVINSDISKSSLGFYLKNIRTVFNEAIEKKLLPKKFILLEKKDMLFQVLQKRKIFFLWRN